MRNVIAPVVIGSSRWGLVIEYRHAVRDVYQHAPCWAEPNTAADCNNASIGCAVLGDESVLEMGGIRLGGNVHATTLLGSSISLDHTCVKVYTVGNHVDAATCAGSTVANNATAIHSEATGGKFGPRFRIRFAVFSLGALETVPGNFLPSASRAPHEQIHSIYTATVARMVVFDGATVHRDVGISKDVYATASKACITF